MVSLTNIEQTYKQHEEEIERVIIEALRISHGGYATIAEIAAHARQSDLIDRFDGCPVQCEIYIGKCLSDLLKSNEIEELRGKGNNGVKGDKSYMMKK